MILNVYPTKNPKTKLVAEKNNVGYKIPFKLCPAAYLGETGENMHTRAKSHLSKFYSKTKKIRESSAFVKHIENKHGGLKDGDPFEDYFGIFIVKAYHKPITNYEGEILNSKTEWHQPKIIRTTILQGGAEMAGGMMINCQQDGRQQTLSGPALTVETAPLQEGIQGVISRTTRAMARAVGGL